MERFTVRMKLQHPVGGFRPTEDGRGTRWRVVGHDVCEEFMVEIDLYDIVRAIGWKAIRSKARVSKLQAGAVIVRAVGVRREDA